MIIELNGKPVEVAEGTNLTNLLEIIHQEPVGIAFAVNNSVVKRADWDTFVLEENMKVTLIKAACGG